MKLSQTIIILIIILFSLWIIFYSPKTEEITIQENEEEIETNWQWVRNQEKLYNLNQEEINSVLSELIERFPDSSERMEALSFLRLNTPYQLGCLGEEKGRDKDPLFRLDVTDCTVFVLTNMSLLHSQTLNEAREMIKVLNYRASSKITFENRFHFTTDRNKNLDYFKDITKKIGEERIKTKRVVLNKKVNGERLIDINWQKEVLIEYLPSENITKEIFQKLPPAVNIVFLKEGDEEIGLDVRHEGFLFHGERLFRASSEEKKIVKENFFDYYFEEKNNPKFDGVMFFEI